MFIFYLDINCCWVMLTTFILYSKRCVSNKKYCSSVLIKSWISFYVLIQTNMVSFFIFCWFFFCFCFYYFPFFIVWNFQFVYFVFVSILFSSCSFSFLNFSYSFLFNYNCFFFFHFLSFFKTKPDKNDVAESWHSWHIKVNHYGWGLTCAWNQQYVRLNDAKNSNISLAPHERLWSKCYVLSKNVAPGLPCFYVISSLGLQVPLKKF